MKLKDKRTPPISFNTSKDFIEKKISQGHFDGEQVTKGEYGRRLLLKHFPVSEHEDPFFRDVFDALREASLDINDAAKFTNIARKTGDYSHRIAISVMHKLFFIHGDILTQIAEAKFNHGQYEDAQGSDRSEAELTDLSNYTKVVAVGRRRSKTNMNRTECVSFRLPDETIDSYKAALKGRSLHQYARDLFESSRPIVYVSSDAEQEKIRLLNWTLNNTNQLSRNFYYWFETGRLGSAEVAKINNLIIAIEELYRIELGSFVKLKTADETKYTDDKMEVFVKKTEEMKELHRILRGQTKVAKKNRNIK
ncbi:hypothetical protein [Vibrio crassostreae]|uniref:hypothetical protein n=1 Tax=Vibrio crassostreae TaxID=246167 RepID=UPI001B30243F|nr:hypothetical protein [Vibrio crassostreae]